jgi:hypothetical protein
MLNPEHVPEVENVNVCGNVTDAPDEGLFSVAEQTALAEPTATVKVASTASKTIRNPIRRDLRSMEAYRCELNTRILRS